VSDDAILDALIASIEKGAAVDWEAERRRSMSAAGRARIDALCGIERIAAYPPAGRDVSRRGTR
jgi:hypothetical protein